MSGTRLVVSNPSKSGPVLRFGAGTVDPATGYSGYLPNNPDLPGALSPDWMLIQWERAGSSDQPEYLNPANAVAGGDYDPEFGEALYSVTSADGSGQFNVFQDSVGNYVYNIGEFDQPAHGPHQYRVHQP